MYLAKYALDMRTCDVNAMNQIKSFGEYVEKQIHEVRQKYAEKWSRYFLKIACFG